ncbi:MAG: LLM class flavin-dependent oxidoreductase [Gammaproteobacteria bacterium]|jgi:alkanesulfonate monooxygenase SsuD/methylene tetrahydromethanopterin reductase-like flavin-dependent oxidoreductase (luciferase family)|nr:LLM class flavin-dependent oxidoreductase [Gammaproteobacteria bacterium]
MRIDVILEANNPPEQVLRLGRLAEECGLGGVWVSNMGDARDPFTNFAKLAEGTERISMGPIAVSPYELHPMKMTTSLLTLNELAHGRAQIVVGAGGGTANAMNAPRERVVRAVRECIEILKAGASGKPVQYQGEIFQVKWHHPAWATSPPPRIYAGANGPQMLRSAARVADGIMVSDFVVEHFRKARAIIDAALDEAGRDKASFPISNFWAWHVKEDPAEARAEASIWLAVRATLFPPYLEDVLDEDEAKVVNENISAFVKAFHTKSPVIEGVPDEIVDKLVARATSASSLDNIDTEIERFRQFKAAGLTEMALRIYENPEQTIRVLGEHIVPALADA